MTDDPRCLNCNIPLRAVMYIDNGRCVDLEACNARRYALSHHGGGYLITPEGVTRIESKEKVKYNDAR